MAGCSERYEALQPGKGRLFERDALLTDPSYRAMQAQLRAASPFCAAEERIRKEIGLT